MTQKNFFTSFFSNRKVWFLVFFVFSFLLGLLVSYFALARDWNRFDGEVIYQMAFFALKNWPMAIGVLFSVILILTMGALRFMVLLKTPKTSIRFTDGLVFAILARYFVLVTPFGLGGQPFTIAVLRDKNVPIGLATMTPTMDVFSMRLAMFLISFVGLWFIPSLGQSWIVWLAWIGFIFSSLIPVIAIALSFFPFFEAWVLRLFTFLTPKKKQKKTLEGVKLWIQKYQATIRIILSQPLKMIVVLLFSLVTQLAILSLPFFLLGAFQEALLTSEGFNYGFILVSSIFSMNAVSWIPTLGNAGAAEFSFAAIFGSFLTGNFLFWTIFLWRFFTFYFPLLLGLWTTLQQSLYRKRELRRVHIPNFKLPLKVFLFVDNFFPNTDGVVRAVDGYAKYLMSQGIYVCVVAPKSTRTKIQYPYETIFLPSFKFFSFPYPMAFFPLSERMKDRLFYEGPAIYHAHSPFFVGEKAKRLAQDHHVPFFATFHSKYEDDIKAVIKIPSIVSWIRGYIMRIFHHTNQLLTVSTSTVKTLRDYGIREEVKVFNNATDMVPYKVTEQEMAMFRYAIQTEEEIPILLFVGQLIWHKNIRLILDACVLLRRKRFVFTLVFVGNGRDEKAIKHYTKKVGLADYVRFVGKMNHAQTLSKYYQLADLLLLPSLYDNDPLVVKEAALHGLPSVVAEGSNAAEKIQDQVNGFVSKIDPNALAATLKNLLLNPNLLSEVGRRAQKTLAPTWSQTLEGLVDLYRKRLEEFYETE